LDFHFIKNFYFLFSERKILFETNQKKNHFHFGGKTYLQVSVSAGGGDIVIRKIKAENRFLSTTGYGWVHVCANPFEWRNYAENGKC